MTVIRKEVLCLLAMVTLILCFGMAQHSCPDAWGHALHGKVWWEKGRLVQFSDISCVSDQNIPPKSFDFIPQFVLFFIHEYLGYFGQILLRTTLIALSCFLILKTLQLYEVPLSLALLAPLLFLLLGYPRFLPRGDFFNIVFTSAYVYLLQRHRQLPGNWIWLLVPLQNLWIHFHHLAVVGWFILVCYGLEYLVQKRYCELRRLLWVGMACIAISFVNLDTVYKILTPFQVLQVANENILADVSEFAPLYNAQSFPITTTLFSIVALMTLACSVLKKRNLCCPEFLLFLTFAFVTIRFMRLLGFFAVFTPAWLIVMIWRACQPRSTFWTKSTAYFLVFACYLVLFVLMASQLFFIWNKQIDRLEPEPSNLHVPVEAVHFLKNHHISGNIYNSYNIGSYVGFHLYPQCRFFIHSICYIYRYDHYRYYVELVEGKRSPAELVSKYGIEIFLLDHGNSDNARILKWIREQKEWHLVYLDEFAACYLPFNKIHTSLQEELQHNDPRQMWRNVPRITGETRRLIRLGNFFLQAGLYQEAVDTLILILDREPQNALALNNMGVALERQKKQELSLEFYIKAIHADPNSFLAVNNLARLIQKIYDSNNPLHRQAIYILQNYSHQDEKR